jgi:YD repeat-containing protein
VVTGGTNGIYHEGYSYSTTTGNLATKTKTAEGVDTTFTYTYASQTHAHAVTAYTSNGLNWSYAYDANGNMTERNVDDGDFTLDYDAENRLNEVKEEETTIATFTYNGDGARVKATVGETTTYYIGNYFEWSSTSTNTMVKYYFAGGARVAMRTGSTLNYLFGDHLGSTNVVTDASGTAVTTLLYKAWGESRYTSGTSPTHNKYIS